MSESFYVKIKSRRKSVSKTTLSFILMIIFLIMTITIVAANTKKNKLLSGMEFFVVSTKDYSHFLQAKNDADEIMQLGGAGYLYSEKGMKIVLFAYKNEKDANNISSSISNYQTQVWKIKIQKLPAKVRREIFQDIKIKEVFRLFEKEIENWYNYSIGLEKNEIFSSDIINYAKTFKNKLNMYSLYLNSNVSHYNMIIDNHMKNIINDINELMEIIPNENKFKGKVKHIYLCLIVEIGNLVKNLSS